MQRRGHLNSNVQQFFHFAPLEEKLNNPLASDEFADFLGTTQGSNRGVVPRDPDYRSTRSAPW